MRTLRALVIRNTILVSWLPLLLLALYLLQHMERAAHRGLDRSLQVAASAAEQAVVRRPQSAPEEIRSLDQATGFRLTVMARSGRVLADSAADSRSMENHAERPEFRQAVQTGLGRAERRSATVEQDMVYLAVTNPQDPTAPVARAAAPLALVRAQVAHVQTTVFYGLMVIGLLSLAAAVRLGDQIVTPVQALEKAAGKVATGDTRVHVIPDGPLSLQRLGRTFNEMVDRLDSQVRSLDEAQGYLDAILRQMPNGLLVLDGRGMITRSSEAAEALLRWPADRMLGRPVLAVLFSYPVDAEVAKVLDGERGGVLDVRTPEGRALRVAVGPLVIRGNRSGAVVILQDVSELRRADEMRRDFVANVSHELRTPIAAIRALVETLLLRGEKRPELLADYGPRVVTECERIERLVHDLLLLAQAEAGQRQLTAEPLDSREIAEEVLRQVEPLLHASNTDVWLEDFTRTPVRGDRQTVGQCLRNLVDNALRYAPGGILRLGSRVEGGNVVLYVADEGPGIPPEDLPRIFERFYRVDKARTRETASVAGSAAQTGGSGLGLSIVRHLAESQGGRVWAESRVGAGSTFWLAFPAHDAPMARPATADEPPTQG